MTWHKSGRADRGSGRRAEDKLQLGARPTKFSVHTGPTCATWAWNPLHSCLSSSATKVKLRGLMRQACESGQQLLIVQLPSAPLVLALKVPITRNNSTHHNCQLGSAWCLTHGYSTTETREDGWTHGNKEPVSVRLGWRSRWQCRKSTASCLNSLTVVSLRTNTTECCSINVPRHRAQQQVEWEKPSHTQLSHSKGDFPWLAAHSSPSPLLSGSPICKVHLPLG